MTHPAAADDPLVARLRAAGCVWAEDEAVVLRAAATDPARLEALTARRVAGEPLELVVGRVDFAGVTVSTAPGVFVPRRRSGALVAAALAVAATRDRLVVLDLCCGTGALAAAFLAGRAAARPQHAVEQHAVEQHVVEQHVVEQHVVEVHAADVSAAAVAAARANLPGAAVWHGDLYAALPSRLRGRVDVLLANAPYVPTDEVSLLPREARDWEDRAALDGGSDGLDVHRRVLADARVWLSADGVALIEVSRGQVATALAVAAAAGLDATIAPTAPSTDSPSTDSPSTVVLVCRPA